MHTSCVLDALDSKVSLFFSFPFLPLWAKFDRLASYAPSTIV